MADEAEQEPESRASKVERQAREAFSHHVMTEHPYGFECKRPNSGMYGFLVTCTDRDVIVSGDIGLVVFRPSGNPLRWVRGLIDSTAGMVDYACGKIAASTTGRTPREFCEQREFVALREVNRDIIEAQAQGRTKHANDLAQAAEALAESKGTESEQVDAWHALSAEFYDCEGPDVTTHTREAIMAVHALFWLARALKARDELMAKPVEAPAC